MGCHPESELVNESRQRRLGVLAEKYRPSELAKKLHPESAWTSVGLWSVSEQWPLCFQIK